MISRNIDIVRQRIGEACGRAGRDPAAVALIAVSKTFTADAVEEAARAGVTDIGENYVQELLEKRNRLAELSLRWHFIGHLQTNKVRLLAGWIHCIHAVESAGLAAEIDKRAAQAGRVIDILVEVNTTGEGSKFGVRPEAAVEFVKSLAGYQHLHVAGLMTIGPFLPDPEGSRPMFRTLRQVRDDIRNLGQRNASMEHLSMGMTGDFEVAVEEGATMVRLGTALFGARHKKD